MTTDDLTRARAVLEGLAATAETARVFGAVLTVEGPTAHALLRLAEAVAENRAARLVKDYGDPIGHSTRCYTTDLAIDAALAEVAALAPQDDAPCDACQRVEAVARASGATSATCGECGRQFALDGAP